MDTNPEHKHIISRVVTIADHYALYSDRERCVQVCDNLNVGSLSPCHRCNDRTDGSR